MPAVTLPPGELMYRWMSAFGSSDCRNNSCATRLLATSSFTRRAEHHDAVLQQPAVDVHRPLFAAALFDDVRNQGHGGVAWLDGVSRMPQCTMANCRIDE